VAARAGYTRSPSSCSGSCPSPRPAPASLSLCRWRAGRRCFWRRVGPRRGGRLASSRRVGRRSGMLWPPPLRMRHVSRAMPFDPSARTGLTPMHPMPTTVAWTIGGRCRCGERQWCRIRVRTCWFGGRIRTRRQSSHRGSSDHGNEVRAHLFQLRYQAGGFWFQDLEVVVMAHHHRMNGVWGKRDAGETCSRFPSHS
jgi:hypothetical protein